jgi:hypothetical protein
MTEDEARKASGQYAGLAWRCIICGKWHPADHEGSVNCRDDNEYVKGSACISCGDTQWKEWPKKNECNGSL